MVAPTPGAGLLDSFAGCGELFARVDSQQGRGCTMRSVESRGIESRTVIKRTVIKRFVVK